VSDAAHKLPCACPFPPVYTGMSPLGAGFVQVAFQCGVCGHTWAAQATIAEAQILRAEHDDRVKKANGHGG